MRLLKREFSKFKLGYETILQFENKLNDDWGQELKDLTRKAEQEFAGLHDQWKLAYDEATELQNRANQVYLTEVQEWEQNILFAENRFKQETDEWMGKVGMSKLIHDRDILADRIKFIRSLPGLLLFVASYIFSCFTFGISFVVVGVIIYLYPEHAQKKMDALNNTINEIELAYPRPVLQTIPEKPQKKFIQFPVEPSRNTIFPPNIIISADWWNMVSFDPRDKNIDFYQSDRITAGSEGERSLIEKFGRAFANDTFCLANLLVKRGLDADTILIRSNGNGSSIVNISVVIFVTKMVSGTNKRTIMLEGGNTKLRM